VAPAQRRLLDDFVSLSVFVFAQDTIRDFIDKAQLSASM
jgi:hypothetical protein